MQQTPFVTNPMTAYEIAEKYKKYISYSSIRSKTHEGNLPTCGSRKSTGGHRADLYDPKEVIKWMKGYKKARLNKHRRGKGTNCEEEKREYNCINYNRCLSKALPERGKFPGCKKCGKYQPDRDVPDLHERLAFAACCLQLWERVKEIPIGEAIK